MNVFKTTCIAIVITFAAMPDFICQAEEPQLKLHGKTIRVYPIAMGEPGKPDLDDSREMNVRIAEVVALMLEQMGMLPDIAAEGPNTIVSEDRLSTVEKKLRAFVEGKTTESDYTLYARFEGKRTDKGPVMTRVCAVLQDIDGKIVWSEDPAEVPDDASEGPMASCQYVAKTLLATSDLKEPATPDEAPYGRMARLMDERSGMPPKPERDAMNKRFEAAGDTFSNSTLAIYPFRIWEAGEGSTEGAEALAKKLTEAGLFQASVADTDTLLEATPNPNQMKIMWDTARDFRDYLRGHPAEADYALLVDVTIPTHHVHLVLCEGAGEWMHVSLMNSHHPDFKEIDPRTLDDCVTLAFRRLKSILNE